MGTADGKHADAQSKLENAIAAKEKKEGNARLIEKKKKLADWQQEFDTAEGQRAAREEVVEVEKKLAAGETTSQFGIHECHKYADCEWDLAKDAFNDDFFQHLFILEKPHDFIKISLKLETESECQLNVGLAVNELCRAGSSVNEAN